MRIEQSRLKLENSQKISSCVAIMGKMNVTISEIQELREVHHHALEAAEQTLMFIDTHATMVGAVVLVVLTSLVIVCACRARCRGAAVQDYIYTSLLHREGAEGQESLSWDRIAILKELVPQVADIVTDVMWSATECTAVAAIRLRMRMRIMTHPENSLANLRHQISNEKLRIRRCEGIR